MRRSEREARAKKKIFAFLFIAVICVSFLPASVWAGKPPKINLFNLIGPYTEKITDPIAASTGEYYFSKTLISPGGLMPLDFTLEYSPLMSMPYYGGAFTLPRIFVSNTWIPLARFNDTSTSPETEYVNIQFLHDVLIFKKTVGDGVWESQMEVKYQLKEAEDYYYLMDPTPELVYVFDKREKVNLTGWDPYIVKIFGRVLYVMDRNVNNLTYSYNGYNQTTRIEDGLRRALNLNYNTTTRYLTEVNDSFGRTITFNYEVMPIPGTKWTRTVLTSVTDPRGNITLFQYQYFADSGWSCYTYMTNQTFPEGNIPYEQTWGEKNLSGGERYRVVSQCDAYGNQTNLSYNESSDIVTVTNPDGTRKVFEHESGRWFKSRTDETGKTFTMDHDASHRPTQITDRFGDITSITYHQASGKIASIINNKGDIINFSYTAQNQTFVNPENGEQFNSSFYNLARIDYPDGTNETFTYDSKGNVLSYTDRGGKTWHYEYNGRGQVTQITNPAGGIADFTYNADATLASSTDSDVGVTAFGYDTYKRLNRITHPDGTFIQIVYNLNDLMTSITDELGNTVTFAYDANGNLINATDPAGNETAYGYDLMDRIVQHTNRRGKTSQYGYDNRSQFASVTDANGNTDWLFYDSRGWLNRITDPAGNVWQLGYGDEGLVSSVTTPLGYTTSYTRDKLGYLTGITNPLGHAINFTRDSMSRITGATDPFGRKTTYGYDERGLLTSVTRPDVGTATYTRNDLGLLANIRDLNGKDWAFAYTDMGRLQSLTDPLGNTWQYDYNERGFLNQTAYPTGETQTRTYDDAGNLVRRQYSDGTDLQFTYDDLNWLLTANNISFSHNEVGRITETKNPPDSFGATYDDAGRVETVTYADGLFTVTYQYDARNLLTQVSDSLTGTFITFSYDDDGRPTGVSRSNGVNSDLTWNEATRLTRIQHDTLADLQYEYNAAGEITKLDYTLPLDPADYLTEDTEEFTFDDASQISSAGYSYDARGRQTATPTSTFTWDGAGRLTGTGEATLQYNGLGDLIKRTEAGTTTHYYYNYALTLTPIVAEKDEGTGEWKRFYVLAPTGQLLYMIDAADSNKVYFYHYDRNGNTLFLTDASDTVTDKYAYTACGKLLHHEGTNEQPFSFGGAYQARREGDSDLYQMRARYYDANTGRFVSRDPLWPRIGSGKAKGVYEFANLPLLDFTIGPGVQQTPGNYVAPEERHIGKEEATNKVKPFGAIDPPAQGGTPQRDIIRTDGSTIHVVPDGVSSPDHLTYNVYTDIADLFPGYANDNNADRAVGYFLPLDTTAYDEGVLHMIQWTATDSAGNTDGIGSRYFTIGNSPH